jgi:hypothetical protein
VYFSVKGIQFPNSKAEILFINKIFPDFEGVYLEILYRRCVTPFTILSSYYFIGHYMFRPNWPSSGVQAVVARDSAVHSNADYFPPIVVASGYSLHNMS